MVQKALWLSHGYMGDCFFSHWRIEKTLKLALQARKRNTVEKLAH